MLPFLFRRLGQSALVIAVMAILVFVGVYAIGNPIDILISPEADEAERAAAIARLGLDKPLWLQFLVFVKSALAGDLGRWFVDADAVPIGRGQPGVGTARPGRDARTSDPTLDKRTIVSAANRGVG